MNTLAVAAPFVHTPTAAEAADTVVSAAAAEFAVAAAPFFDGKKFRVPEDEEKTASRAAFNENRPDRVPVELSTNPRIILANPKLNPEGTTFEEFFTDPEAMLKVQLRWQEYRHEVLSRCSDVLRALPESWTVGVVRFNIFDAAYFGARVCFRKGQVPDTEPPYTGERKEAVFDAAAAEPLQNPFVRDYLELHEKLTALAEKTVYRGRPVKVGKPAMGFDGPLTVATNLRGVEIYTDLLDDPEYFDRLLRFIIEEVLRRNNALRKLNGDPLLTAPKPGAGGGLADDSVQLLGPQQYREAVLPHHKYWYARTSAGGRNSVHLCGDASRHFQTLRDECNVYTFDTGFPIDHGRLRKELGEEVLLRGGAPMRLLRHGSPQEVYEAERDVLRSGVKRGGRFILTEANNLPPCVPPANLAALYRAALEFGRIE